MIVHFYDVLRYYSAREGPIWHGNVFARSIIIIIVVVIIIIIRVFCSRVGLSLQTQAPRLQFRSKAGLPPQTQELRLNFTILFSIWTDFKRSEKIPEAPAWRWGEWIWLAEPSGVHRNTSQGSYTSSIRVFEQIRYPEIPITLRPKWPLGKVFIMLLPLNEVLLKIHGNASIGYRPNRTVIVVSWGQRG